MDHNLSKAHRKVLSGLWCAVFVSSPGDTKMSHTAHGMTSQQLTAARFSEKKPPEKLTMLISFLPESACWLVQRLHAADEQNRKIDKSALSK
jgi:hypothetical protein